MVTVKDLIKALSTLPQDTLVIEISVGHMKKVLAGSELFMVYRDGNTVQLHVDDGAAYHKGFEGKRERLL